MNGSQIAGNKNEKVLSSKGSLKLSGLQTKALILQQGSNEVGGLAPLTVEMFSRSVSVYRQTETAETDMGNKEAKK